MKKLLTIILLFIISSVTYMQIPTQGLIAYYPFNGNANDASGNGNNGTVSGATLVSDRFGNSNSAYHFNGTTDQISCGNSTTLQTDNFSIACWINPDVIPQQLASSIICKSNKGVDGWTLQFVQTKVLYEGSTNGGWDGLYSTKTPQAGSWYFVVMTYNNSMKTVTGYINGVKDTSRNSYSIAKAVSHQLIIGNGYNTLGSWGTGGFKGVIDDVRIYNRSLTDVEVSSLFIENGWTGNYNNEFFDDFNYQSVTELETLGCGWKVRTESGAPPANYPNIQWTKSNVSFPKDGTNYYMRLKAQTRGDQSNTYNCEVGTQKIFLEGTYAAKVKYYDVPTDITQDGDAIIQTFYSTSPYSTTDPFFSEIDFEYAPNSWNVNGQPMLNMVSWGRPPQSDPTHQKVKSISNSYNGDNILIFQVSNGKIKYFLNNNLTPVDTHDDNINPRTYPLTKMQITFSMWYNLPNLNSLLGTSNREYWYDIDWVYFSRDGTLTYDQIISRINYYRQQGIPRNPITAVERNNELITSYKLFQNYPNPFNPITRIQYSLPNSGNVCIKIYDILGRQVETLVNDYKISGTYTVDFNGTGLTSGVYFYQIQSSEFSQTKKLLLLK